VHNFQEHPQSNLLTECMLPRLRQLCPDGQFCIGADSGIYWRLTHPILEGCKAPDWFVVLGVPPMLNGELRRSYVLWQEVIKPLLLIEYVSGDGKEERDRTPYQGKFWVYEQGIGAPFYAIYEVEKASVEVYRLDAYHYVPVPANASGRFPIPPLGIELGIWGGSYRDMHLPWLRAWDAATGELLPLAEERADNAEERADTAESLLDDTRQLLTEETERAESERKRAQAAEEAAEAERKAKQAAEEAAEAERKRTQAAEEAAEVERKRTQAAEELLRKLAEKLRAAGIDPET
jgi:Uma2 family endonuclease